MRYLTLLLCVIGLSGYVTPTFAESTPLVFELNKRHDNDLQRDKTSKGHKIVALAGIKEGMQVFDLFGGGGYFSELIANYVGTTGKVYLHNNKAYMPWVEKELTARLKGNRLPNVIRYDREVENLDIAGKHFDAMFYVLGYHDIYHTAKGWKIDREQLLTQISQSLKAKAKLVIIDHSAKEGSGIKSAQVLHRIDPLYVQKEIESLGFTLVKKSQLLANPNDPLTASPFAPELRRKTDRFVLIFEKH